MKVMKENKKNKKKTIFIIILNFLKLFINESIFLSKVVTISKTKQKNINF